MSGEKRTILDHTNQEQKHESCNTIDGVGKDVESVGTTIKDTTSENK
ncbi:MAG TPA: entericidin A/B family lipoprotein [Prosthecochloris aestuarii]|uniref:Entericidin A/B family lipoprotein n=1 Tax=Prosthecochloris aestuarii TaxID=1102 RepID=A0A831SRI3_PROAE|nr:entericidin A/B family lipoprotein [Prosthecochloris aestuarii]